MARDETPRRVWRERARPSWTFRARAFVCKVFAWTTLALGVGLAGVVTLNYTGYCWNDSRFLSEREQVVNALYYYYSGRRTLALLSESPNGYQTLVPLIASDRVSFAKAHASAAAFYEANPECCEMVRPFLTPNEYLYDNLPVARAFGFIEGFVVIDKRVPLERGAWWFGRSRFESRLQPDPRVLVLPVKACGQMISFWDWAQAY